MHKLREKCSSFQNDLVLNQLPAMLISQITIVSGLFPKEHLCHHGHPKSSSFTISDQLLMLYTMEEQQQRKSRRLRPEFSTGYGQDIKSEADHKQNFQKSLRSSDLQKSTVKPSHTKKSLHTAQPKVCKVCPWHRQAFQFQHILKQMEALLMRLFLPLHRSPPYQNRVASFLSLIVLALQGQEIILQNWASL